MGGKIKTKETMKKLIMDENRISDLIDGGLKEQEKTSKVAICEKCQSFVLACDINYLDETTEKEFTDLSNLGFTVKLESKEETMDRKYSWWEDCKNGKCNQLENK